MGGGFAGMGGGWMGFGILPMLLFWAIVILGAVALIRWLADGSAGRGESRAFEILKARYAKGELTREQYDQMKRELAD